MNTFSQAARALKSAEVSLTENGAKAWATSDSKVLDLFGKIGSARGKNLTREFSDAMAEDEYLAVRVLLWTRDVRGGSGERGTFRSLLKALEKQRPELAGKIMSKVPFLGRWDDLFAYEDPINRKAALRMYADALMNAVELAAKWAPREMSSKKATTPGKKANLAIANELRKFMGLSSRDYRQLLSRNTNVVESQMCKKEWTAINFSHVPSVASARYQKAFGKNASEAYSAYIRELQKPESERDPKVKINASAVYPYDVLKSIYRGNEAVANAQWNALPNFIGDAKIMPMVDVSESMSTPLAGGMSAMDVALSLGLYCSERTSSDFKNMFITFTSSAHLQLLSGSLSQRLQQMRGARGYDTNLESAFNSLLSTAKNGNVSQENMPDSILILSDMQFNHSAIKGTSVTALESIRHKYAKAGYKMPNIVFWNLTARADNTPVKTNDAGVALVSGFSPSILQSVLSSDFESFTPYKIMMSTIMNDRYDF